MLTRLLLSCMRLCMRFMHVYLLPPSIACARCRFSSQAHRRREKNAGTRSIRPSTGCGQVLSRERRRERKGEFERHTHLVTRARRESERKEEKRKKKESNSCAGWRASSAVIDGVRSARYACAVDGWMDGLFELFWPSAVRDYRYLLEYLTRPHTHTHTHSLSTYSPCSLTQHTHSVPKVRFEVERRNGLLNFVRVHCTLMGRSGPSRYRLRSIEMGRGIDGPRSGVSARRHTCHGARFEKVEHFVCKHLRYLGTYYVNVCAQRSYMWVYVRDRVCGRRGCVRREFCCGVWRWTSPQSYRSRSLPSPEGRHKGRVKAR